LYAAIIEDSGREDFAKGREILEAKAAGGDAREFFTTLATLIADHQKSNPNYLRLILFSALEKHELSELCFERHATVIHQIVTGFIKNRTAAGLFRQVDAPLAARSFMGMVMHYVIFDQHFGFKLVRASRKRSIEAMVDIFLQGLKNG
jgi:AcrR family transcriptional regulator